MQPLLTFSPSTDGSPKLVSLAILIDNVVNLSLDIVFIKLLGWGIEGSSTATVIGHLVGIAMMCRHFWYKDNHLRLTLRPATQDRIGLFALAVCMNLLMIYNLFLAGVERTIQTLGAIEVGRGDNATLRLILRKSFRFITVSMLIICVIVWVFPEPVARVFGADSEATISETASALRAFAISLALLLSFGTVI